MSESVPVNFDFVNLIISREEIEARDTSRALDLLASFLASFENIHNLFEKLEIAFHGYNDDNRELFEIPEVREYVHLLDQDFPYWLFFLTKSGLGLQCLMFCFLPPYLTEDARKSIWPDRLEHLLSERWFPAMNHLCDVAGFSAQQVEKLADRVAEYFINGPIKAGRPDSGNAS